MVAGLVWSGCAEAADPGPTCSEERLAAGTAFRYDPALALAVAHAMAEINPELTDIVDTVAEYQRDNPDFASVTLSDDDWPPDSALDYILVLVTLTVDPTLATPRLSRALEQAAERNGIAGIHVLLEGFPDRLADAAGAELSDLGDVVAGRSSAARDAGMIELPNPGCA